MDAAAALLTHFRKYYPESPIRVSRYYWNINKPQLFWCILILKEDSQNADIFISALPVLWGFLSALGWFSLSPVANEFLKGNKKKSYVTMISTSILRLRTRQRVSL